MDPHKPECHSPSQSLQQSLQQEDRTDAPEQAETAEPAEAAVMAAVDGTGADERLVIADTTCDDAWVSVDTENSLSLDDWR